MINLRIPNLTDMDLLKIIDDHYPEFTGVHPACLAVPLIPQDQFEGLVESIYETGLMEDIVRTKDRLLLDGRCRLLACYVAHQDIRVVTDSGIVDPWVFVKGKNIDRRHLEVGPRSFFALEWRKHLAEEARERMKAGGGDKKSKAAKEKSGVETFPQAIKSKGKTRDKTGELVGVSGRSVDKAATIAEFAPDVAEQVKSGEVSLEAGYKEAGKRKLQTESRPVETSSRKQTEATTTIVTAEGVESEIKLPAKVVFNSTTQAVDWAAWTWNPVTGCNHGCDFCYARELAHSQRMADYYPNQFEPTFHEYRLEAPRNTKRPKNGDARSGRVFVCSMADLFGKWVPAAWIRKVFDACLASPEWEYLFLTKWPARYSQLPLIDRAWYGASVIRQSDVSRVESAMQKFAEAKNVVRWISLEPMLEPIVFNDLSWCDLVVIGSQTQTTQPDGVVPGFAPEFDWVVDVVNQCREAEVPYFLKANLGLELPGMRLPKNGPRGAR